MHVSSARTCSRRSRQADSGIAVEKRKHGRMMTVIRGLAPADNNLPDLLKRMKNTCGAGGSLDEECLEIQGAHLDRIRDELKKIGYRVKG